MRRRRWNLHSTGQECRRRWNWVEHRRSGRRGNGHHRRTESGSYQWNWRWRNLSHRWFFILERELQEKLLRILVPVSPEFPFRLFDLSTGNLKKERLILKYKAKEFARKMDDYWGILRKQNRFKKKWKINKENIKQGILLDHRLIDQDRWSMQLFFAGRRTHLERNSFVRLGGEQQILPFAIGRLDALFVRRHESVTRYNVVRYFGIIDLKQ